MDRFIPHTDELGNLLQKKAEHLYQLMQTIQVEKLGLSEHGTVYFLGSHFKRLFFSIQTSAHLLYNSIKLSNRKVEEVIIMDYGAGIGSLYLLAKMIGCKKVIYNDILEEWKQNALLIAAAIDIDVDEYLVGNIDDTLVELEVKNIKCDIITSRNVIEHIYQLDAYYLAIIKFQPQAIVYSSTTANFYNPAMNLQHVLHHTKTEKIYRSLRFTFIQSTFPHLTAETVTKLAKWTQGYESSLLIKAVEDFEKIGQIPAKQYYYTNTCDYRYGVWAENLLPYSIHRQMIETSGYTSLIEPGFWDTHYQKGWLNLLGKLCNSIMGIHKSIGFLLAPFIYVVAVPEQNK